MEHHGRVSISAPPHSGACIYFELGLECEELVLTTGARRHRNSNPGFDDCEPRALPLSYLTILTRWTGYCGYWGCIRTTYVGQSREHAVHKSLKPQSCWARRVIPSPDSHSQSRYQGRFLRRNIYDYDITSLLWLLVLPLLFSIHMYTCRGIYMQSLWRWPYHSETSHNCLRLMVKNTIPNQPLP